ncbi:MAG: OsmC family protein [Nitrospinota bacterium]|nr:OsmC family protein [Nitrospinota bacterium]
MYAAILEKTRKMVLEDSSKAVAVYRVKARLVDGSSASLSAQSSDPMSFEAEVGPNFGLGCSLERRGEKLGMVPGEMFLGSIGSCVAIAFAVHADIFRVKLDDVTVEVVGETDMRGALGIDPDVDLGFCRITMDTIVQSGADMETLLALTRKVDAKSPVLYTARKGMPVEARYSVNGRVVDI